MSPQEALVAGGPAEAFEAQLEDLSSQLMSDGAGVQAVAWEHPKRER